MKEHLTIEANPEHVGESYTVIDRNGNFYAKTYSKPTADRIAALPDLLSAAKEALRQLNAPDCPPIPDGAMVRGALYSAIQKAEGVR